MIEDFIYDAITLAEPYCVNAFQKEIKYLKSLEADRLLAGFRESSGLQAKAIRYPGWEITEIQGHTLGHYLAAISQAYAYCKDSELRDRITYICEELSVCQREDGFLFAYPEEIFDRIENQIPAWVPWYTMHKILVGLETAYRLAGESKALMIVEKLGNWIGKRVTGWSKEQKELVLKVEYGGMNDALYQLYEMIPNDLFLEAAHCFDEISLFESLYRNEDILDELHANTTIPKIIGALKRYTITKEDYYLTVAENFWSMVVKHHTYVTGGNSEWEHFGKPDILNAERTAYNCETCNTHNMLRLSKMLFQITGEGKYNHYYERTFINSILASQNPDTGMAMYFQPMETGLFKVFSKPFDNFWCCTGTGMENFTKLWENIFQHDNQILYINRYLTSELLWKDTTQNTTQCHVDMQVDFPNTEHIQLQINQKNTFLSEIRFRIPDWVVEKPIVTIEGNTIKGNTIKGMQIEYSVEKEYGCIDASLLGKETKITIGFATEIKANPLPDDPEVVAFSYGPYVLCAGLGKERMDTSETGVNVTVPVKHDLVQDDLTLKNELPNEWLRRLQDNLVKKENEDSFHLNGAYEDNLVFTPYYKMYQERYGIYWKLRMQRDKSKKDMKE